MKNVKINGIFFTDGVENKINTEGELINNELSFNLLGAKTKIDLVNKKIYRYLNDQEIQVDIKMSSIIINLLDLEKKLEIPINITNFLSDEKKLKLQYNIENIDEIFLLEIEFEIM